MAEDEILSKEAWPLNGIQYYCCIEDGDWGYLVHYKSRGLIYEANRPSNEEILERWGSRFSKEL
ncbi:hypothetical protein [uncultured Microbulbifer sp.]|uniref:hypothetical protein n=1 Tax=uncultured Microbulbifer sp. TaxID=348147 RepID=UPI00262ED1FF|nr:hypothetical protein [uncultured Microbulbifer sp.]